MLQKITHFGQEIEIDIPDGYEVVREKREGLMVLVLRHPERGFGDAEGDGFKDPSLVYIAPIRLRLGENYRTRDGRETGPLVRHKGEYAESHPFMSKPLKASFRVNGTESIYPINKNGFDIIAHIPKEQEKKMEDIQVTVSVEIMGKMTHVPGQMQVSEAARLYREHAEVRAEVERQEKERQIGPKDWFWYGRTVAQCDQIVMGSTHPIRTISGACFEQHQCTKITDPAFIAFLEQGVKKS